MKILVIDDELQARKRIINLIEDHPEDFIIEESSSGHDAIEKIKKNLPELLFLDIDLTDMTGFDVLKNIKSKTKPIIVFVTAYDQHAVKAFDYNAFDFLLKPYKDKRFYETLRKVRSLSYQKVNNQFEKRFQDFLGLYGAEKKQKAFPEKIPVKKGNKTLLLSKNDITCISASGNYAEIFTPVGKHLIRDSLHNLSEILDPDIFVRVHRSTIVNINFIQEIIHSDYSEIDLRLKDNTLIRVSKSHKKTFLKQIGI